LPITFNRTDIGLLSSNRSVIEPLFLFYSL